MMQRFVLLSAAALSLAACQPQVPDSGRGAGFGTYGDYMRQRDGTLAGAPMASVAPFENQAIMSGPIGSGTGAPLDLAENRPRGDAPRTIQPQSGEIQRAGTSISDEQNFNAVAQRETIASDAERRRAQQAQYVQVQPTALPQRTEAQTANIVQFAVSTSHAPGTKMYSRGGIRFKSYEASCAPFTSADLAQEEFLRRGGPNRDPLGVDPDGDGFACGWDPRPFRIR
jgi:hypothetical protein